MKKCVILSNSETSTLPLIRSLAVGEEALNLVLLSDAAFLLDDSSNDEFFNELEKYGVNLYITKDDYEKRSCQLKGNLQIISYESLVELMLSERTKVINF
jgi:sulfur relay protein TusB/DsrH